MGAVDADEPGRHRGIVIVPAPTPATTMPVIIPRRRVNHRVNSEVKGT